MRFVLINPPHTAIGSRVPDDHLPPLGLLSIGGPLIDAGHRVRLLAQSGKDFDLSGYVRFWLEQAPKTTGNLRVQVDIDPQSFL